ncbi:extracellular solute-binding protein [Paenibacillus sp. MBLB4367]|uniref:extracellular solute-binding protein n=1 Tax=Paenibacillus sp. MBLB4367 TaxID=3384767 RepID=UPI0039080810
MGRKLLGWLAAAVIVAGFAATYMTITGVPGDTGGSSLQSAGSSESIAIWVHSEGLADLLGDYQSEHPELELDIRTFRSGIQLYEELTAAISTRTTPQIAELDSLYGVAQLAETGALLPADGETEADATLASRMPAAFTAPFRYKEKDWAVPFGGGIPVLYANMNMLRTAGIETKAAFGDWEDALKAGEAMTKDVNGDGATDYWGLAVDRDQPWYFQSLLTDSGGKLDGQQGYDSAFALWKRFAYGSRVMKPLQHQLAASDFINGKAGLFISGSDRITMLEKYIGGKFVFEIAPLPRLAQTAILPEIRAFALIRSTPEKEQAALRCIRYALSDQVQLRLLRQLGLLPARWDIADKLMKEEQLTERERFVLEASGSLAVKPASLDDPKRWKKIDQLLETIELVPESSAEKAAEALRSP